MGANLRYVEARLPHLGRLLAATPQEALDGADAALVVDLRPAVRRGALRAAATANIIDLNGRLGAEVERLAGYEGWGGPVTATPERPSRGSRRRTRAARPHHRPEPARPLRPPGLAGVPGADGRRVRRHRGLPEGQGRPAHEVLDGVTLLKYRPYAPGGSAAGSSSSTPTRSSRRRGWCCERAGAGRFDVLQACNPPDIFWPLARWLRLRDGSRFVFDHHDLCPELYDSRFPRARRCRDGACVALERATFRTADHVVSTNESYADDRDASAAARRPATSRSSAPAPTRTGCSGGRRDPELRRGRRSPRRLPRGDGPAGRRRPRRRARPHHIVHDARARRTSRSRFMGGGDCYDDLVALRDRLGLQDYVELPGRVPDDTVVDVLSTADVGLSPDPKNPLNDVSTMNKTLEYMAFELPVVAFDLKETRVSAEDAAVYVDRTATWRRTPRRSSSSSTTRHGARRWAGIGRARIEGELRLAAPARRAMSASTTCSSAAHPQHG